MGSSCGIRYFVLYGDVVPYIDSHRTSHFLGYVAEEMANRLAERFGAILCYSGTFVVILVSIDA